MDFAGRYIEHFLSFLGIEEIALVKLDQLMIDAETKTKEATQHIKKLAQSSILN
jgi:FMN-dependent NADH-azoreductase